MLGTAPKPVLLGPVSYLLLGKEKGAGFHRIELLERLLPVYVEVFKRLHQQGATWVQLDEPCLTLDLTPALREGLPLRRTGWPAYLAWAVRAFRVAASGVRDETQIHVCYLEFNDMLPALDADVIPIETSRLQMELLEAFADFAYPNQIGPGVYDSHSPRGPSTQEMVALLTRAHGLIPASRLWVNPDCGLKTHQWPETEAALRRMVAAAQPVRAAVAVPVG